MKKTKKSKIESALRRLNNPSATNQEIATEYEKQHGERPSPQSIYESLGRESTRRLRQFNAAEMIEAKTSCKEVFNGDYDRFHDCIDAVRAHDK